MAEEEWKRVARKIPKKQPTQKPKKFYWSGFDANGNELWYVEFTNGSILSDRDPSYAYWHRKFFASQ